MASEFTDRVDLTLENLAQCGQRRLQDFLPMPKLEITELSPSPAVCDQLAALLIETVALGGSVSFMHPLEEAKARAFWDGALAAAGRGERIVLGGWIDGALVGTVSVLLDCPPNQPHRAEIAKMMTAPARRDGGVGTALLRAAEAKALACGRSLLTLDTAVEGGAAKFYERLGYTRAGLIPDYAFLPHGGLTGTLVYWKKIGPIGAT